MPESNEAQRQKATRLVSDALSLNSLEYISAVELKLLTNNIANALAEEGAEYEQTIAEFARRLRLPDGNLPCAQCGGSHAFDTSVPSVVWNRVIRAKGLPEYLCLSCIVREFARLGEGFTAQLWNEEFYGVPIEVVVNGQNAEDAAAVSDENTTYRVRIAALEDDIAAAELRGQAQGLEMAARQCEANFVSTDEPLHSYRGGLNEAAYRYAREIRALSLKSAG